MMIPKQIFLDSLSTKSPQYLKIIKSEKKSTE